MLLKEATATFEALNDQNKAELNADSTLPKGPDASDASDASDACQQLRIDPLVAFQNGGEPHYGRRF